MNIEQENMMRQFGMLFALPACMLLGCASGEDVSGRPATEVAGGIVTLDGSPVVDATVTFNPEANDGHSAFARTDAEGQFQLMTFEPEDGAVAGEYIVTITKYASTPVEAEATEENYVPPGAPGYKEPEPPKNDLPAKYSAMHTSDLRAVVEAGEKNEFDFKLVK